MDSANISEVWQDFISSRSPDARERLIVHYLPLVREVASSVAKRLAAHVDRGDLESYGTFGLIDAVDRFDPSRGVRFEAFAAPRIRGQIFDEIRLIDPAPRLVRARAKEAERVANELAITLGRQPSRQEIAARMGCTVDELERIESDAARANPMSYDSRPSSLSPGATQVTDDSVEAHAVAGRSKEGFLPDVTADVEADWELGEKRKRLAAAVAALDERDRVILSLYYLRGLSWDRIAEALGVVKGTIVRLHDRAINQVRDHIRATA